jgi:hypothetical protein
MSGTTVPQTLYQSIPGVANIVRLSVHLECSRRAPRSMQMQSVVGTTYGVLPLPSSVNPYWAVFEFLTSYEYHTHKQVHTHTVECNDVVIIPYS